MEKFDKRAQPEFGIWSYDGYTGTLRWSDELYSILGHEPQSFSPATDGARRLKRIILDLLEFSRAGKYDGHRKPVDMNALLKEHEILRSRKISETGALIEYQTLPVIRTLEAPLIQVVHNILDNALKYVMKGTAPRVTVNVTEETDFWRFEFSDNGIGIDPEYFEKVFIFFQRLHNRDAYSGTGMGLVISKKNIESLGGTIWLRSVKGRGSVFTFTLPK